MKNREMKKEYKNPSMHVVTLKHKHYILAGSGDPIPPHGVPWWDGEGGARAISGVDYEDEEDDN